MSERYRVIGWGDVIELDDPHRDPRLVGNLSWTTSVSDSRRLEFPAKIRSELPWDNSRWGELVADCPCEDCQAQREASIN